MASNSSLVRACPAPFLPADLYPATGGYLAGRFCSSQLGRECCLPCSTTAWFYPERFSNVATATDWVNVASLLCALILLVSFACLPVDKTHRHYLSVCLALSTMMMNLGFIVPLAARPQECFNDITPHDMYSDLTCAWSGSFVVAGGWCCVMWVFLRSVALHLQICWQWTIGKVFMWTALAMGWGMPAVALTLALLFSGVSYRFGSTCHINHERSMAVLWIPLLVFAGATLIIQLATFAYCIKVYLASLSDSATTTTSQSTPTTLPSYAQSTRTNQTLTPRQAYRRVRRVIALQWRGIMVVLLIVANVVFFAIVFLYMDDLETSLLDDPTKAQKWITCLVIQAGDKDKCAQHARELVVSEATITAVLLLLSLNGFWALLFLGRLTMFAAWCDMLRARVLPKKDEFVSADAHAHAPAYEMLSKERDFSPSGNSPLLISPPILSPATPSTPYPRDFKSGSGRSTPDYFSRERRYSPISPPRLREAGLPHADSHPSSRLGITTTVASLR